MWTVVAHTKATGADGLTTSPINTAGTAGRAKVAYVAIPDYAAAAAAPTFIDSNGNTYQPVGVHTALAVIGLRLYICLNPIVGAGHKVTTTGTGVYHTVFFGVLETDVAGGLAYDAGKATINPGEQNINLNVKPGTTTPTGSALCIAACASDGTGYTAAAVLSLIDSQDYIGGTAIGGAVAFAARNTATDPQFNWTANVLGLPEHMAVMQVILDGQTVTTPLKLNELTPDEVIPLDIATQANPATAFATVQLNFVYNPAAGVPVPANTELQIYKADGATILKPWYTPTVAPNMDSGNGAGGKWRIVPGGPYRFAIRTKNVSGGVIETSPVTTNTITGIGYGILPCGQSHLARMEDDIWAGQPAAPAMGKVFNGTPWAPSVGSGNRRMLTELIAGTAGMGLGGTDIPWFITRTGIGGAGWGIDGGDGGQPYYTGGVCADTANPLYPYRKYWVPIIGAIRNATGNFLLMIGGSSDAIFDRGFGQAYADMQTSRANMTALCGHTTAEIPAFIGVNGRTDGGDGNEWEDCKRADLTFAREQPNAFLAASLVDCDLFDAYHLVPQPTGYERVGRRVAQSILKYLGIRTYDGAGFTIASAVRATGSADVYLTPAFAGSGSALKEKDGTTDGAGLTGFAISKDSFATSLAIAATAFTTFQGSPAIKLTLAAVPADNDRLQLRYQYGPNPTAGGAIASPVYDNTAPGGDTLGRVLLTTSADAVNVGINYQASVAESAAASDTPAVVFPVFAAVAEIATLADTANAVKSGGATGYPLPIYLIPADGGNAFQPLHIDASESYGFDWTEALPEGEIIIASSWIAGGGVSLADQAFDDTHTRVTVTAEPETFGHQYRVTNRITRQDGEPMSRSMTLRAMWP